MFKVLNNFNKFNCFKCFNCRHRELCSFTQYKPEDDPILNGTSKFDQDWSNAKPFEEIPGPSKLSMLIEKLPGGEYRKLSFFDFHSKMLRTYGPLVKCEGVLGRRNLLFAYEPESFETMFRVEGTHPIRIAMESLTYCRTHYRPDLYSDFVGITESQGEKWAIARSLVNPILLKPQNVVAFTSRVDEVATEFQQRLGKIRDSHSLEVPPDFEMEVKRWALESAGTVALNTRLGLINGSTNSYRGEVAIKCLRDFLHLVHQLDVESLSWWKFFKTPKLKELIKIVDDLTNMMWSFVCDAKSKLDKMDREAFEEEVRKQNMLAYFLKTAKTEKLAMLLALDILLAGVDTTVATTINILLHLAKNPDKQDLLREEILTLLPEKDTKLTAENMKNLPYLRAVIRETHRRTPITIGTGRTVSKNIVLNGYQVPEGTNVIAVAQYACNDPRYVPNPEKFMPERWIRDENGGRCPESKIKHPFVVLPFGFGKRICAGRRIAQLELEVLVSRIVRNFRIEYHYSDPFVRSNLINAPTGDIKFKFIDIEK